MHLLRAYHVVSRALQGECDAIGGIYFGTFAIHDRHQLATIQHTLVLAQLCCLFPSTFGIRGFLRISSMGGSLQDIIQEYQALWIQVIVYFFTACLVYRYQILQSHKRAIVRMRQMEENKRIANATMPNSNTQESDTADTDTQITEKQA